MQPEILFEDNHILVVNKPAGYVTQPTNLGQKNMEEICKAWIKEKYNKPGNVFLGTVHRLDKPVSGIVLFAKTSKALERLNESMRKREIRKFYCAVVEGVLDKGVLEHYLFHDEYRSRVVSKNTPQAKFCRLVYESLQSNDRYTLVEIELETGRYHQIRAQFSAVGHSIVGDEKYGSFIKYPAEGIALHHSQLDFLHPTKNELISIKSPLPDSILDLVKP
jgi:23S rRNA pseudouridine1911/1915/1917 synthase